MNIHPQKWAMLGINLVGGAAVIGSYVQELSRHPGSGSSLWGGVPEAIRPLYTISMLLAAAGYFAFTSFILLRARPGGDFKSPTASALASSMGCTSGFSCPPPCGCH